MPKYSFIVPVYNCGKYLKPCVESLLAQTFRDFEILLIDDSTPDDGGAVCDELAAEYDCVRTFHKVNGGAASARNYGIDRAGGEYLLFIDGDDTIEPDTLERIEKARPGDLVIFGMSFDYYENGMQLQRVEHLSMKYPGIHPKEFYTQNLRALFEDNALSSACNKVFSARILRDYNLCAREDMTLYEDFEFVLRYFACVDQFCCINVPLYHYRIDAAGFGSKRTHDISRLQTNMDLLAGTILGQDPLPEGAGDLVANLYMQLLVRHLLATKYQQHSIFPVFDYCESAYFGRSLEMGASLGSQEAMLLEWIKVRDAERLLRWQHKKRAKIALRRVVKKTLKMMGLRR